MNKLQTEFKKQLPNIKFNEPLSHYSTFQIGGPADFFYKLKNTQELHSIIDFCQINHLPFYIFGGGSNVLFDDKGFRGLIIKMENKNITFKDNKAIADSGVAIPTLVRQSVSQNLTGLEPWIGLPGTVGGAVSGNAGCNGLEAKDVLIHALLMNTKNGQIREVGNKYFHFKYRDGKIKKTGEIVINATFQLTKSPISQQEQNILLKKYTSQRIQKQPFGSSSGCFFKNPTPNQSAGALIDQAGLKGKTIGKAQISEKHANFFLNLGGATSKDLLKLAKFAKKQVKAKFSVDLEHEVQILSQYGPVTL